MHRRLWLPVLFGGLSPSLAGASLIYDAHPPTPQAIFLINEVGETDSGVELPGSPLLREFDARAGDSITFAGTDRFVTSFATRLWSFDAPATPITTDVQLTLYQNAGGLPGVVIWTGTIAGVSLPGTTPVEVAFAPNVTVPDSICFAIALSNINAQRTFGPLAASNVFVGSSPNSVLLQSSDTLAWRTETDAPDPIFRHVDARVTAIPAPAAAAVGLLGLLTGVRRRR